MNVPVAAQSMPDHDMQGMDMHGMGMAHPAPPRTKPAAKKHATPASHHHDASAQPPAAQTQAVQTPAHGMDAMPMDHGATMPASTNNPAMPMDMPGMVMPSTQPRTPIPVLTDADRAAAQPPAMAHPGNDEGIHGQFLFDRFETWNAPAGAAIAWEARAWIGTDTDRLWLRSEGERRDARTESADVEVFYGRHIATWWDGVIGIRHDLHPGSSQDFAAIGLIGTAPYKIDVAATVYIGATGQTATRIEADYDVLLSNRWILQPRVEVNLYGRNDPLRGIGSGLSTLESGLRLRYEITRRFAPYVGVEREQAFGGTADLRRAAGEGTDDLRWVAGLRFWF
ncbi:MAG: copper resistance protein B [Proteobacteria bacterium]|nr:copper resistance protein B [Pseudomonadota bacterium]